MMAILIERESNSRKMRRLYNDWTLRPIFTGTKTTTVATARGVGGWKEREREVSVWCTHLLRSRQKQKQRWANFKTLALKKKVKVVAGKREPENKVSCVCVRCASL
jgi:hypothetical protein